jgi:hypothetical protein
VLSAVYLRVMEVRFCKEAGGRLCAWVATPHKRRPFQGTTMASGRDLPHDLATFVVEVALGLEGGFWNLVANGATFKSIGRRQTNPGRSMVNAFRAEATAAETTVNTHVAAWRAGNRTQLASPLTTMLAQWRALVPGEELIVVWPTRPLPRPATGSSSASAARRKNGTRGPASRSL